MSDAKRTNTKGEKLAHISAGLRSLAIEIGELEADDGNARLHGERNMDAIRASLERFGQQAPVIYVTRPIAGRRRRVVIKGNGILAAAKAMGWKHIAAAASTLGGDDAKAYAIADNRTTDLSEFDAELLAAQLQELEEAEYDILAAGFTDEELQDLIDSVDEPGGRVVDGAGADGRKRGERTVLFLIGHLKFQTPRAEYDRWMSAIEGKVGNDPDRVVAEIKRRLRMPGK